MIYKIKKIKSDLSRKRKEKGASTQIVVIVITIALILLLLMIPVLEGVFLISMIKKYANKACRYSVIANMLLSRQMEEKFKSLCNIYGGGTSGGAGASGDFECYGDALDKDRLIKQLAADEGGAIGDKYYLYLDSAGKATIGIGHNLDANNNTAFERISGKKVTDVLSNNNADCKVPLSNTRTSTALQAKCPYITSQQAQDLLTEDLKYSEDTIKSKITSYNSLPGTAKQIVVEMFFQMGIGGLNEHTKMITALNSKNWEEAAAEIIDSARYGQLHCEDSTPKISTATDAATKFRTTYPDESWITSGSCRVLRQAARMGILTGNGECRMPEPVNGNATCVLEQGIVDGQYSGEGKEYPVYHAVVEALKLVKIDESKITVSGAPKYINADIEHALEQAAADQDCSGSGSNCFSVNSAYRSCRQQQDMINSGKYATIAAAGLSNHNGGQGIDIVSDKAGYVCNSDKCSKGLVDLLLNQDPKIIHFKGCSSLSGGFYTGDDCVHFSLTGR